MWVLEINLDPCALARAASALSCGAMLQSHAFTCTSVIKVCTGIKSIPI